jgi:hypothetical protein
VPTTSTGPLGLRLSSLVRAAGTTASILFGKSPGLVRTGLLAGGTHLAAREIDPAGLQVFSITPKGDINIMSAMSAKNVDQHTRFIQDVTTASSWVGANLLLARLARVLPWSRPFSALLLGAGVYLADDYMVNLVERLTNGRPPAG